MCWMLRGIILKPKSVSGMQYVTSICHSYSFTRHSEEVGTTWRNQFTRTSQPRRRRNKTHTSIIKGICEKQIPFIIALPISGNYPCCSRQKAYRAVLLFAHDLQGGGEPRPVTSRLFSPGSVCYSIPMTFSMRIPREPLIRTACPDSGLPASQEAKS